MLFIRGAGSHNYSKAGEIWETDIGGTIIRSWTAPIVKNLCFYALSGMPFLVIELDTGGIWLSNLPWPAQSGFALRRSVGSYPRGQFNPLSSTPDIVIFDRTQLGTRGLLVFNPVNLRETAIDNGGRFPWPCLSPRATKIVAGADGGQPNGLYLMDLNGSNLRAITVPPISNSDHQPAWVGEVVVFVRTVFGNLGRGDIYKITGVRD